MKLLYREYLRLKRLQPHSLLLFYYSKHACDFLGHDARLVAQCAAKCVLARDTIKVNDTPVEIVYAHWANGQLVQRLVTAGHHVAICRLEQETLPDLLTHIPSFEQLSLIRSHTDGEVSTSP